MSEEKNKNEADPRLNPKYKIGDIVLVKDMPYQYKVVAAVYCEDGSWDYSVDAGERNGMFHSCPEQRILKKL